MHLPKPVASVKNFVVRNERKILITTTVTSTALSVVMFKNVSQLNEFLKQHDLLDQYYGIAEDLI
jgi:hypothetical protein